MLVGTRPDALVLMWDAFGRGQSCQYFIELMMWRILA